VQRLEDEALARRVAALLAAAPASLEATLVASLDAMRDNPPALEATARAIEKRPDVTVTALVQRELATRRTVHALAEEIQRNGRAQEAFVEGMRENSHTLAAVLTKHPDVMLVLFNAIGKAGLRRGGNEFEKFLTAAKD